MRYLGLDIGERRIGVAVSDPDGKVATPLKVVSAASAEEARRSLERIVEDYEPSVMVVGLPMSLSGEEGPQADYARRTAEALSKGLGVPVTYWDERLSSAEAKRVMAESGLTEREMRGKVDMVAASLVLQSFLDCRGEAS